MPRPTFLDSILNRPSQYYAPDNPNRPKSRAMSVGAYPTDLPNAPQAPQSILSGNMFQGNSLTQASNPKGSSHFNTAPPRPTSVAGWSTTSSLFGRKKKKDPNSVIDMFSDAGSTVADGAEFKQRKARWWESGGKLRGGGSRRGPASIAHSTITEPAIGGYNARTDKRLSSSAASVAGGAAATAEANRHSTHYDAAAAVAQAAASSPRRTAMSDYGGPGAASSTGRRGSTRGPPGAGDMPPLPAHDSAALRALNAKAKTTRGVAPLGQQPRSLVQAPLPASVSSTSLVGGSDQQRDYAQPRRASSALGHYPASSGVSEVTHSTAEGPTSRKHKHSGSQDWHEFMSQMSNKEIAKTWTASEAVASSSTPVARRNSAVQRVAKELQADAEAAQAVHQQRLQASAAAAAGAASGAPTTSLAQAAEQIIGQSWPAGAGDTLLRQQGIAILPPGIEPGSLIVTEAQLQALSRPISPAPPPGGSGGGNSRPMSPVLGAGGGGTGRDTPATLNTIGTEEYETASEPSDGEEEAPAAAAAAVVKHDADGPSSDEDDDSEEDVDAGLGTVANPLLDPLAEVEEDNSSAGHSTTIAARGGVYRHHEMRARPRQQAGYSGLAPGLHLHPASATQMLAASVPRAGKKGKGRAYDEDDVQQQRQQDASVAPTLSATAAAPIVNPLLPSPQADRRVPAPPPPPRPAGATLVPSIEVSSPVSSQDEALRSSALHPGQQAGSVPPTPPEKDVPEFPAKGVAEEDAEADSSSDEEEEEEEAESGSEDADVEAEAPDADEIDSSDESDSDGTASEAEKADPASALIRARQKLAASNGIAFDDKANAGEVVSEDEGRESLRSSTRAAVRPPTIQRRLSDLSLGNSFRMSVIMRTGSGGGGLRSASASQRAASSLRIKLSAEDEDSDGDKDASADGSDDEDLKRRAQAEQDRLRNMKVGEDFFGPDLNSILDRFNNMDWDKTEASNTIDKYGLATSSAAAAAPGALVASSAAGTPPGSVRAKTADERAALEAQDRIDEVRRQQLERRATDSSAAAEVASVVPSIAALWLMNQEASGAEPAAGVAAPVLAADQSLGSLPSSSATFSSVVTPSASAGSEIASPGGKAGLRAQGSAEPAQRKSSILDRTRFMRSWKNKLEEESQSGGSPKVHARSSSITSSSSAGVVTKRTEEDGLSRTKLSETASFYNTAPNTAANLASAGSRLSSLPGSKSAETTSTNGKAASTVSNGMVPSATQFITPPTTFGTLKGDSTLSNNLLSSSDSAPSALGKLSTGSGSGSLSGSTETKASTSSSILSSSRTVVDGKSAAPAASKPLVSAMKKGTATSVPPKPVSLADSLLTFPLPKRTSSVDNVKKARMVTTVAADSSEDEEGALAADSSDDDEGTAATSSSKPSGSSAAAPPSAWATRQAKVAKSERKAERSAQSKAKAAAAAEAAAKAAAEAQALAEAEVKAIGRGPTKTKKRKVSSSKSKAAVTAPRAATTEKAADVVPTVAEPPAVTEPAALPTTVEPVAPAVQAESVVPEIVAPPPIQTRPGLKTTPSSRSAGAESLDVSSDESFVSVAERPAGSAATPAASPTVESPAKSSVGDVTVTVSGLAPPPGTTHTVSVTVVPPPQAAQSTIVEPNLEPVPEHTPAVLMPASVASSSPIDMPGSLSPPLSDMWSEQSAVSTNITSPGPADSIISRQRDLSPALHYVDDAIANQAVVQQAQSKEGHPGSAAGLSPNLIEKKLPLPPTPDFSETTQVPLEDRTPLARPIAQPGVGVNLIPPTPPATDMPGSPLSAALKATLPATVMEDPSESAAGPTATGMQRSLSSRSGSSRGHSAAAAAAAALPAGLVLETVSKTGQKKVRTGKLPGLETALATSGPKHPNVPRSLVPLPPEIGANIPLEPGLASLTLPPGAGEGPSSAGSDSPSASPAPSQSGRSSVASSAVSRSSRASSSLRYQLGMSSAHMRGSPALSERRPSMAAIDEWESSASPYGHGLPGPLNPYPPLPASALTRSTASLIQGESPMVVRQAPLGAPASHFLRSNSPALQGSLDTATAGSPAGENSPSPLEGQSVIGSSYAPSVTQSATSLPLPRSERSSPLVSAPSVYRPVKDPSKLSNKIDEALYGRTTMQTISITSGAFRTKSISRKAVSSVGHGNARDDASIRSSGEIPGHLREEMVQTTMALSAHTPPPRKVGSSQVLVQVIAVAIDEMDRLIVQDRVRDGKGFGFVPGRSFCGRVMECGWDVKRFRKGDIVFGLQDSAKCGALAEFMTIEVTFISKAPEDCLTTEQISALPATGVLSHEIVATYCSQLERGSRVLILNAHDGIGLLVMQQSVELGLIIVAQCPAAIADGVAVCRANGAHEVVVGEPLWAVNSLHESSFDLVVDTVGGRRMYDASRRILATNGQFATCFGDEHGSASPNFKAHMRSLRRAFFKKDKKNIGYEWVGNITVDDHKEALESVKAAAERGDICPRLSSILPFEDAVRAFDPVLRRAEQEPGAVVVRIS